MSTPERDEKAQNDGNHPSPPPPGSPPGEGVAVTGGDTTAPDWEGAEAAKVDPPIAEAERPRASDT